MTKGETLERNPIFSKINPTEIYYDCTSIGYDAKGVMVGLSFKSIAMLNTETYELVDIRTDKKYPGVTPRKWQLVKYNLDTQKEEIIKSSVMDYDIDGEGDTYYSKGKYLPKLCKDGKEEEIVKSDFITKITV